MNKSVERTVEIFGDLSEVLGVNPPASNDILGWWVESLESISDIDLMDLIEFGFFENAKHDILKGMRQRLVEEVEKRQSLHTLA